MNLWRICAGTSYGFMERIMADNPHYPKIINENTFYVSKDCWKTNTFYWAARTTARDKIAPTFIGTCIARCAGDAGGNLFWPDSSDPDLSTLDEAIHFVQRGEKTPSRCIFYQGIALAEKRVLRKFRLAADASTTLWYILPRRSMDLESAGQSGMGSYTRKKSFDTFSHYKSILKNSSFLICLCVIPPATARKRTTSSDGFLR